MPLQVQKPRLRRAAHRMLLVADLWAQACTRCLQKSTLFSLSQAVAARKRRRNDLGHLRTHTRTVGTCSG